MFSYKNNNELYVENVNIIDIIAKVGTPFYCYSLRTIQNNYASFRDAVGDCLICFAVKANPNLSVLRAIAKLGSGADVVSEGEIRLSLTAGIPATKIVFSGVGKTSDEIAFAIDENIHQINVESIEELKLVNDIAASRHKCVPIAVRLNPDIDSQSNYKMTTGRYKNKFGTALGQIASTDFKMLPNVELVGISAHIGSMIRSLDIFSNLIQYLKNAATQLNASGHRIRRINVGGGLAISYAHLDDVATMQQYGTLLREHLGNEGFQIICEPGRSIVANSGILLSKVLYKKHNEFAKHVVIDAGMNDFMRPAIYGATHQIIPARRDDTLPQETVSIVGPVCETSDTFATDYTIQELKYGDYVAICDVGAYGVSMSNTYNSRLIPPEVLVNDVKFAIIRNRGNYESLLKQTNIPDNIFN